MQDCELCKLDTRTAQCIFGYSWSWLCLILVFSLMLARIAVMQALHLVRPNAHLQFARIDDPRSHAIASDVLSKTLQKKKMSLSARAQWRKILDYARQEATTKIQSKAKRFMGLRKFAELAAKRKAEAAERKKRAQEEEDAQAAEAAAEAAKPKK